MSAGPYATSSSEVVRIWLKKTLRRAKEVGQLEQAHALLQAIESELVNRPLEWGDPVHHYEHLKLQMFRGLKGYFVVDYGVYGEERIVFIQQYRLLPWNPLV